MFIRVLLIFVHKEVTTMWLLTIFQLYTRWDLYTITYSQIGISQYLLHKYSIIKNQRDGLKLVHEGYMYTKKYLRKNVRWECASCYAFSCKCGLTTDDEVNIA